MSSRLELKEGWSTVALLLFLVLCVAWSIQAVQWVDGLSILQGVVLLGALSGVVLAKSRLPALTAHLLAALTGVTWVAWLNSRVLGTALELTGKSAVLALDWRLQVWVAELMTKGQSSVANVFLVVLSLLMWLTAYFAAWAIFRWQRAWWAVILCSVAMIINITATSRNLTVFLLTFLLLALLLVVRTSLASYELEWRRERVHYGSDLTFGVLRAGLIVSLVALALAWLVPEAVAGNRLEQAWRRVSEPWRDFQASWSDLFQDLKYSNDPQLIYVSRSMQFGGPVRLTDRPIMDIRARQGTYWRNWVYQEYTGSGWTNTDPEPIALEANAPLLAKQPQAEMRESVTQTITLRDNLGIGTPLTAAGTPLSVNLPVLVVTSIVTETVELATSPRLSSTVEVNLPTLVYPRDTLPAGTTFRMISSRSTADAESLRDAGAEYPDWVVPRYIELPDSLPDRVRLLAQGITAGLDNPFDKVVAIESFLRKFPYSEIIPGPKPGQDGVDYFLFEEKQGYCTYYASAMVVLLRASGVPARYVEGYSQAKPEAGVFRILEKDGHAWPEVYFSNFGWVEFEPTASKPATSHSQLRKPAGTASTLPGRIPPREFTEDSGEPDLPPDRPLSEAPPVPLWRRVSPWVWGVLGFLALCAAGMGGFALRRRSRISGMSSIERVYYDLVNWAGTLLRIQPLAHQTPHEFAAAVGTAVPARRAEIDQIVDLYAVERFGGKLILGQEADGAWRQVWPMLCRRWFSRQAEAAHRLVRRVFRFGRRG